MKWRFGFLVIILMCILMLSLCVRAEAQTGKCGDNLTWTLTDDGTLTISGSGDMYNYSWNSVSPWYSYRNIIISLDIKNTVTSIGSNAFTSCSYITEVYIPESITSIGYASFFECQNLSSINIPGSVSNIGDYAFKACTNLQTIDIQYGLTLIGKEAFQNCANLVEIILPDSIESLGSELFHYCSNLEKVSIPLPISASILDSFFDCPNLKFVSLSDCTLQINGIAGAGSCGDDAYWLLDSKGFLRIWGNGSMNSYSGWKGLKKSIIQVEIEEGVTTIGDGAFSECNNLKYISIPKSIVDIGSSAFSMCPKLEQIVIPDGVTTIKSGTFMDCVGLVSASLPENLTSIGNAAFGWCNSIKSINIPSSVKTIGASAFNSCKSLKSIILPEGLISIGAGAFCNCGGLKSLSISSQNNMFITMDGVLFSKDMSKLLCFPGGKSGHYSIPSSVKIIAESAFIGCSNLTSISIPTSVTSIRENSFEGCTSLATISIPDSVTSIGECTFLNCTNLISINMLGSLTNIGRSTFSGCTSLTSVTLPESVINIDEWAFSGCESLSSITIPESVTTIGDYAFHHCISLTKVYFSGDQIAFGSNLFNNNWPYTSKKPPIIYCYAFTGVDEWATQNGYTIQYLDDVSTSDIRTITLSPKDSRLACGKSLALGINIFPNIDIPAVVWCSSDPAIVSVENGVLTAISDGTAVITATVGNVSDTASITTYTAVESFTINPSEMWLIAKENLQLSIDNVMPENAIIDLAWSSSDTDLATVNDNGLVTTKFPGDVIISANSTDGVHAEALLHLCYPVTDVSFENQSLIIGQDITVVLKAFVTMRTQSCVNHLVTFASSDENIAMIDDSGLLTPSNTGTVIITATAKNGISNSCTVIIKELSYMSLPKNIKTIEAEAFAGTAFEAAIIPNGCTTIGSRAFADCPNLVYVRIPASVTSIAEDAFEGCEQVVIDRIE